MKFEDLKRVDISLYSDVEISEMLRYVDFCNLLDLIDKINEGVL